MKKIASARVLFGRAWAAAKATWKTLLPLMAAIQLLSYGLNQLVTALPLPELLRSLLTFGVAAIVSVLSVGVTNGMLGYQRGKTLGYDCIGSMLPHAGKVICLFLLMFLCVFAWMLPGMGAMLVGGVMIVLGQNVPVVALLGGLLTIAGMAAALVLACYALFGYGMSNCILIDAPAAGVSSILRQSKFMMHGYRWHYFKVGLPVMACVFVLGVLTGALTSVLPLWLSSLISALVSAATATMGQCTCPVMYEELRRIGR